ncbi:hypothetical protein SRHO_G00330070 [Serrasalmus rhombeus]
MMENGDLHAKMRLRPKKARTPLFQLTRDIVRKHLAEEEQGSELEAQLRPQKRTKRAERQVSRERGRKAKEDDDTLEEKTETLSSRTEFELLLERERLRDQLKASSPETDSVDESSHRSTTAATPEDSPVFQRAQPSSPTHASSMSCANFPSLNLQTPLMQ